jgi:two-component sensor histidine kinase
MQFILEQQAQFLADMQQLKEAQALNEQRFGHLSNVMLALAEAQTRSEDRIASLAESQERLAESQQRTEGKLAETDERLNSLITVVERYIIERRNGKPEDQGS